MGLYINPKDCSKEDWLLENSLGRAAYRVPSEQRLNKAATEAPAHWVCLVDNGGFTAAAIAFNSHELEAFNYAQDQQRQKYWFIVPDEKLIEVEPHCADALAPYNWNEDEA